MRIKLFPKGKYFYCFAPPTWPPSTYSIGFVSRIWGIYIMRRLIFFSGLIFGHEINKYEPSLWPRCPWILRSSIKWIECPPGVWEDIGSNPAGDSDFFFVPHSWHADYFIITLLLLLLSLLKTILNHLSIWNSDTTWSSFLLYCRLLFITSTQN